MIRNLITRWIANALALLIITQIPHIGVNLKSYDAGAWATLAMAGIAIGLVNALIRPVVMFFGKPINCLTFGLFGLLVNAGLFYLVGNFVPGFAVEGFLPALIGSIAMGAISGLLSFLLKDRGDRDK